MKKVYLVTGLACSGKTTIAKQLADELNCKMVGLDRIYEKINEDFNIPDDLKLKTPYFNTWENLSFIGVESLGKYTNLESCVRDYYRELFEDKPDLLVIEGVSPIFNSREMSILKEEFKDYEMRCIFLNIDYETWLDNRSKRKRIVANYTYGAVPPFMLPEEYNVENEKIRQLLPDNYLEINSYHQFNAHITERSYQGEALNEPKWDKFHFDLNEMKGKSILDISCNSGWYLKKFQEAGAEVYGIDADWRILDACLDRVPQAKVKVCRAENLNEFTFGKKFDYVLCSSAFHYYVNREQVLENISKLTDYFVLELPLLEEPGDDILYQEQYHYAIPSRDLIFKWLNKYFSKVEQIDITDYNGVLRPVLKSIK